VAVVERRRHRAHHRRGAGGGGAGARIGISGRNLTRGERLDVSRSVVGRPGGKLGALVGCIGRLPGGTLTLEVQRAVRAMIVSPATNGIVTHNSRSGQRQLPLIHEVVMFGTLERGNHE
jgi:hypothetical protein